MDEPIRITCLNGRFTRAHRAAVGVADRGFRFGDGAFETIRLTGGIPYQWELHYARLEQGLATISIPMPTGLAGLVEKTIVKNGEREGFIRIAVSRGSGSKGYLPFPTRMPPTLVIEYLPPLPRLKDPYRLWLSPWAKIPAQCLPGKFKLAQGLNSTLALQDAHTNGCDEALQLTTDGMLSETASANLFWISEGTLYTPSLEAACLSGTTRDAVLRLAPHPTRSVMAGLSTLEKADAIFITNTRLGIHPVAAIQPMGWQFATDHPMIMQLKAALQADRERARHHKNWASA